MPAHLPNSVILFGDIIGQTIKLFLPVIFNQVFKHSVRTGASESVSLSRLTGHNCDVQPNDSLWNWSMAVQISL